MPGFGQLRETEARWRRFPGRERIERGVALTFDDGPDPDATPAVLDALDAAGLSATFFLVGEQLLAHHELGREIADRGHAVAAHGFRHIEHDELENAWGDLVRSLDAVEAATGVRPGLFRPPYGRCSDASYAAVRDLGLETVYWSSWGMDWEPLPADRIAELVVRDLAPGAIVLLHDSARYAHRADVGPTIEAIPLIAEAVRARGLEPVTLPSG